MTTLPAGLGSPRWASTRASQRAVARPETPTVSLDTPPPTGSSSLHRLVGELPPEDVIVGQDRVPQLSAAADLASRVPSCQPRATSEVHCVGTWRHGASGVTARRHASHATSLPRRPSSARPCERATPSFRVAPKRVLLPSRPLHQPLDTPRVAPPGRAPAGVITSAQTVVG